MAFQLASAFVSLGTRLAPLRAGMMSAKTMVLGALSSMTLAAAAFTTTLAASIIGAGVRVAMLGEQGASQFTRVFGKAADGAHKFAKEMAVALGRTTGSIEEMMARFQQTFLAGGIGKIAAAEISKRATSLAQDLAAHKGFKTEMVAGDLDRILAGSNVTARKYNVTLNDTVLKQELLKMGFRGTVKQADEATRKMARLNIMLKGTKIAQGAAEKGTGSFTARLRGLRAAVTDILDAIGQAFLPALAALTKIPTDALRFIEPYIARVAESMRSWSVVIINNWALTWQIMIDI